MAAPSLTYTLTNGSTADASQVMENLNNLLAGYTDGTKDLSFSALTCAGTATLNGHVNLGNSSSDDLTITASLASTLAIKTTNSYDIGSSTKGLAGVYLGANSQTVRIVGSGSMSATWTMTLPVDDGTTDQWFITNGSGVTSWANTVTTGKVVDGSADEIQLRVQGNGTQTNDILVVEKSDGTDLLQVTNTAGTKIRGTTTNDSAAAGFVGEHAITNVDVTSAPVSLTSPNTSTIASLSLTAGDWLVAGVVTFQAAAGTTGQSYTIGCSTTLGTLPAASKTANATGNEIRIEWTQDTSAAEDICLSFPPIRVSLASTTTIYLVAAATFSVSTMTAGGSIWGVRIR